LTGVSKDGYLRRLEEWDRARKAQLAELKKEKPYDPASMDVMKMPFGCWILMGAVVFILGSALGLWKFFG
jgi:hypothetical protein